MIRAAASAREADAAFRLTALRLAAAFGLAWLLFILTSRFPGYAHHDTTEIFMWSRVGWPAGFSKHPPLLPWMVRAISTVLPVDAVTLGVIAAVNIAVGAFAVWRIACMTIGERPALLALCLYMLSPYVGAQAVKLNHNSILVSLWPLIIWAFLAGIRNPSVLAGALFGAAAAAGALAKYYSLLLLAACFTASLVGAERDRYYRAPAPYVAVAVFAALVAPHLHWLATNDMQPMQHALRATASLWRPALRFAVLAPLLAAPMLLGVVGYRMWCGRCGESAGAPAWSNGTRHLPELVALSLVPYLLTVLLTIGFRLQGSTTWAMPAFSLVPILLAAVAPRPGDAARRMLLRATSMLLSLIVLAGPAALVVGFRARADGAVEPRVEFAKDGLALWRAGLGGEPRIVAGDMRWATAASLELPSHPLVWVDYSPVQAPWITADALARDGFLALCRSEDGGCSAAATAHGRGRDVQRCRITRQRNLYGSLGPAYTVDILVVAPLGRTIDRAAGDAACRAVAGSP